ncbi:hypothetical protein CK203_032615 [Vitis vinifera]|uniref:Uncharacterized protein n=1 Tax=Vitis vinifera TaxID=29760 RepID=A0A438HXV0_VITVI|nr:hypothetical protein CK203_032615 [Vitis vinifera]
MTEISRGSVFALGKCRAHLLEVGFNNHGRFIRILEFATNRKPSVLIIPEGDKGRDPMQRQLVTKDQEKWSSSSGEVGGAVVCESKFDRENWAEEGEVKIVMKDRAILPAMLEVTDGDWVFTVVVVVVGDEEKQRGSEKGESTRVAVASHTGTGGGRRGSVADQRRREGTVSGKIADKGRREKGVRAASSRRSLV